MLDEIAAYNQERWEALAQAGVEYSRPFLDLTPESAMGLVNGLGLLGESLAGLEVLCLAGGGGQQSAAFGLLGARVTVLDLCETQLARDAEAARHYGHELRLVQGDMRDLSCFGAGSFDVVWHAHSLNFVPEARRVFEEVARVLRPGGVYRLSCWDPHAHAVTELSWNGTGYVLGHPYGEGHIDWIDETWDVPDAEGVNQRVVGPKEFRHSLETLLGYPPQLGFRLLRLQEESDGLPEDGSAPEPGSWGHFGTVLPQWLVLWWRLEP